MSTRLVILIPVFNDWAALDVLLQNLDRQLSALPVEPTLLVVDDGSSLPAPPELRARTYACLHEVRLLPLLRNLGHQRAIATGLVYVHEHFPETPVLVMDGDGEDDPKDIARLLEKFQRENGEKVIFAERTRRAEGAVFKFFYALFKTLHWLLTGLKVRVGNFSIMPYSALSSLVVSAEIWNHYAAAVFHARLPRASVPTTRANRLAGQSSMNFVGLVTHGLSAISVYGDLVGVRLLIAFFLLIVLAVVCIGVVIGIRLGTNLAIAGWATYAVGLLIVVLLEAVVTCFLLVFVTLSSRSRSSFLPRRDCHHYIGRVTTLFPHVV